MKSPFLKTYLALAVLAALGGWVWWSGQKKDDTPAGQKPRVFAFDKAKVKEIRLEPWTAEAVVVSKAASGWQLGGAAPAPAAASEVDGLIASLEGLEAGDTVSEAPTDLKQYGLDPARLKATLVLEDQVKPLVLLVGAKSFDSASVYAQRAGERKVFVIPAFLAGGLEKKPFDLRDRDLLHLERDKVKKVEVTGPEGAFTLEKQGQDWALAQPLRTPAGRWPVDGLLGTLEGLRMESVAAEEAGDLKPFGLDKPARTVKLTLEDGSARQLEIGSSPAPQKFHAREALSKLVAVIPGALVDDLAKGWASLRARRLLDVSNYDVTGLEGKLDGTAVKFERRTEKSSDGFDAYKWKKDGKELDPPKMDDALYKLTGLEAQSFVDQPGAAADYGLDAPVLELKVSQAERPAVTLTIGKKGDTAYARRSGDDALLQLEAAKVDEAVKALKGL